MTLKGKQTLNCRGYMRGKPMIAGNMAFGTIMKGQHGVYRFQSLMEYS
jgi:hypothetical protein